MSDTINSDAIDLDYINDTLTFSDIKKWEPISLETTMYIALMGKYYNPAWKHYENVKNEVNDDKLCDAIKSIVTIDDNSNDDDNDDDNSNTQLLKKLSHSCICCDRCGTKYLTECYGYLDKDICVDCYDFCLRINQPTSNNVDTDADADADADENDENTENTPEKKTISKLALFRKIPYGVGLNIAINGTYYNPAWKHYSDMEFKFDDEIENDMVFNSIRCDFCGNKNLKECYGLYDKDICTYCRQLFISFSKNPLFKDYPMMKIIDEKPTEYYSYIGDDNSGDEGNNIVTDESDEEN
jgi:hypothetical protein